MNCRYSSGFVLATALAIALAVACGDSDSPTGNNNTGGSQTLTVPAGSYEMNATFYDCETGAVMESMVDTLVNCKTEAVDEFFGYDCAIKRSGNNLTLKCQRTYDRGGGCSEKVEIDVKGTVSGDHYELAGTFEFSDTPADCWDGSYCDSLVVTLDRIGAAPSACTYADENTVALTITGGAQAGKHILDAFGSSDNVSGNIQFFFGATSNTPVAAFGSGAVGLNGIYINGTTDYLDPSALPATLSVVFGGIGAEPATSAGGPQITMYYSEGDASYYFNAETATSGSFVVRELSDGHMAGTFNMTVTGTQYDEAHPTGTPAQRTLSGGCYVTTGPLVANQAVAGTGRDLFGMLLRERR